ncbi:DUF4396 domain-containing protein [Streptomyces adelaidensis]|uniref:DUF4396 domain-containing protein n=1 Tax=Streptomyces adelaidensis TaxID=2796465 RepID=UPI001903519D|nr:DUF4396 domain-containing protein [Streptomyces adelaidensis]
MHNETHAHGGGPAPAGWATAVRATPHRLTGRALGEVLGMVIGTALGWDDLPTPVPAIVLAFFFGYALTLRGMLKAGVDLRAAVRVAPAVAFVLTTPVDKWMTGRGKGHAVVHQYDP